MSSADNQDSSLDGVQPAPVSGAGPAGPSHSTHTTKREWQEHVDQANARSAGNGASFKAWIDKKEAAVIKENEYNEKYGVGDDSDEDVIFYYKGEGEDEDEDEGEDEDEDEDEEVDGHGDPEAESETELTNEEIRKRAAFPFLSLPPMAGSIHDPVSAGEEQEDPDEYMGVSSNGSLQDDIDNCDIHSAYWVCTCEGEEAEVAAEDCDVHGENLRCTCHLGADDEEHEEDAEKLTMDIAPPS